MRHFVGFVLLGLVMFTSTNAHAGVKLVTTAKSPEATGLKFNKILVVLLDVDNDLRRRAEGGLARRIPGAVAASAIIPDADIRDRDKVIAAIKSNGVDGVIVLRNVNVGRDYAITPGNVSVMVYPNMWDYWGSTWAVVEQPGYAIPETSVSADIAIFSIVNEKMVWAGRMTATDPQSLRDLLDNLVKVGRSELKKQKIV